MNKISLQTLITSASLTLGVAINLAVTGSTAQAFTLSARSSASTLRILPYGDSNTVGFIEDKHSNTVEFEDKQGYRNTLNEKLKTAGFNVEFVGSKQWCIASEQGNRMNLEKKTFRNLESTVMRFPTEGPITAGFEDEIKGTYRDVSDDRCLFHEGVGGITLSEMLGKEFPPRKVANPPKENSEKFKFAGSVDNVFTEKLNMDDPLIVLLMTGTNDIEDSKETEINSLFANLQELTKKILEQKSVEVDSVFVSTIQPFGENVQRADDSESYNELIRSNLISGVLEPFEDRVFFVDHGLSPEDALNRGNVHPGSSGYEQMAQKWFEAIVLNADEIDTDPIEYNLDFEVGDIKAEGKINYQGPLGTFNNDQVLNKYATWDIRVSGISDNNGIDTPYGFTLTSDSSGWDFGVDDSFFTASKEGLNFTAADSGFINLVGDATSITGPIPPDSELVDFSFFGPNSPFGLNRGDEGEAFFQIFNVNGGFPGSLEEAPTEPLSQLRILNDSNVRFSAQSVPEPGTILSLIAFVGLGLGVQRKSHRD